MNFLFLALAASLGIYILFVLFFISGLRRINIINKEITTWPTVSVIIAARNEENNLPGIFQDLTQLDYPKELLNIVIVDDRSTDNTWSLITHFADQHAHIQGIQVKEKSAEMTPKKYALTQAVEQSTGEYILSTDADCRIPQGWAKSMVRVLENGAGIAIGSSAINTSRHTSFVHYQLVDFLALVTANAGAMGWGFCWTGSGQNLAYKRKHFTEIDGFNPVRKRVSGDDIYLVQSIGKKYGCAFNSDPHSFIKTKPVPSLKQFISQRIRWSSNSRFAAKTDLFFLFFLFNAFVMNTSLLTGLFFPHLYSLLPMVFGVKFMCDALVIFSGAAKLHLVFPSIIFMFWSIIQPFYIPFVGLAGLAGRFKWKP
ncbi:MAG TPA: glycosyltransferase [Candidatus Marinimicrobia bacterium]|jgi:cellulose synthase/poly-beta-1,6-N-acetylglucosamine synthase-like glycosyltransferase|nr:glycosyltransferase [Candidatus Neomarinimicrobiota bacterium]HBN45279.1 hypothetical protein [Candidatus Neomarinimicrobiota bacterium]HJL75500.1 glycosyltransferase [Candidatus Neomarinimicrobiota bacterium]HJM69626.1 glycosyltransferase [Candidatus Neomarinimicrobiota bacterium]|tara:strand:+ start:7933 stop:9039 length:1107 start_codon:yes stop_codon:yes gene_type:complete